LDKGGGGQRARGGASGSAGASTRQGAEATPGPRASDASASARTSGFASGAAPAPREAGSPTQGDSPTVLESLTDLETRLAVAVRACRVDGDAEARALAAFRAARDSAGVGRRSPRTRRRDDWRPRGRQRRPGRSLRAAVGALLASVALGGVAMASMGTLGTSSDDGPDERPRSQRTAPSAGAESAAAPSSGDTTTPDSSSAGGHGRDQAAGAKKSKALCRAYLSAKNRGHVLDATAWRRLVDAAGGEASVKAYCDEQLASDKGTRNERTGSAAADGAAGSGAKATQEDADAAKESAAAETKSATKSAGDTGDSVKADTGVTTAGGAGG
jgi:hypothetical protein